MFGGYSVVIEEAAFYFLGRLGMQDDGRLSAEIDSNGELQRQGSATDGVKGRMLPSIRFLNFLLYEVKPRHTYGCGAITISANHRCLN